MIKTYSPKASEINREWFVVDASQHNLGRLATLIATYLQGKHKPTFAPHLDMGDNVIVLNVAKLKVTGNKLEDKHYYRHSGYPGGIYDRTLQKQLEIDPTFVIRHAVAGMLPKNRLQADRLLRLKLYVGSEHPHAGQSPKPLGAK